MSSSSGMDPRLVSVISDAADLAGEWASDNARDELEAFIGVAITHGVESPIERLFLAAFAPYVVIGSGYRIDPQVSIGKYRADFVVTHDPEPNLPLIKVVVECDGHDFHERTKEQAAHDKRRDRYMASQGYTVMRFTGRELWKDPAACVEEVIDFTQRKAYDTAFPKRRPKHELEMSARKALVSQGIEVDPVTMTVWLDENNLLDEFGGASAVLEHFQMMEVF